MIVGSAVATTVVSTRRQHHPEQSPKNTTNTLRGVDPERGGARRGTVTATGSSLTASCVPRRIPTGRSCAAACSTLLGYRLVEMGEGRSVVKLDPAGQRGQPHGLRARWFRRCDGRRHRRHGRVVDAARLARGSPPCHCTSDFLQRHQGGRHRRLPWRRRARAPSPSRWPTPPSTTAAAAAARPRHVHVRGLDLSDTDLVGFTASESRAWVRPVRPPTHF